MKISLPNTRWSLQMSKRRGQMFILATMLIAVYVVTMASVLVNFKTQQIEIDRETLREPYLDSKREIQYFLEMILAYYSKNNSLISNQNLAIDKINEFLTTLEITNSARGVISEIQLQVDSFILEAQRPPYENTSEGGIYTSQIKGEFYFRMSTISSSLIIEEYFNISFIGRIEVTGNTISVQQSRDSQFTYVEAQTVYVSNETTQIIPRADIDHTGIYYFDNITSLDNFGVLNASLSNGISIFS